MKYQIKQKIFSLTDSFTIEDGDGRVAFEAKGKLFSISSSQTLYNRDGDEVLKIKRKYLSLLPACRLVGKDGSEWLIKKCFWPFWRDRFVVQTDAGELSIDGNLWDHEYHIRQQGRLVASVSKAWFSWSDTYGVEVFKPEWTAQLLALVIVIDRISHAGKNSAVSDD